MNEVPSITPTPAQNMKPPLPPGNSAQSPTPQSPPPQVPPKESDGSNLRILWIALIMFILGIVGGILLTLTYPKILNQPQSPPVKLTTTPTSSASTPSPSADLTSTPVSSISTTLSPTHDQATTSSKPETDL